MLGGQILKNHLSSFGKQAWIQKTAFSIWSRRGETKAEKLFFIRKRVCQELVKIKAHSLFWHLLNQLIRSDLLSPRNLAGGALTDPPFTSFLASSSHCLPRHHRSPAATKDTYLLHKLTRNTASMPEPHGWATRPSDAASQQFWETTHISGVYNFSIKMYSGMKHDSWRFSLGANLLLPIANINLTLP